jgi:hypothetical protein
MTMCTLEEKEKLDNINWTDWTRRIIPILELCDVWEYVAGKVPKPNKLTHPISAAN